MIPKKILIITYYWPPAGGPGVQRWLKFVKYLPDFGITPIVFVPKNPTYPIIDLHLEENFLKEVTVLKHKIFEPYKLATFFSKKKTKQISSGIIPNKKKQTIIDKILLWIRGNLFVPDARVFWVKPSISFLEKYIFENKIDTIITTGPPHSLHLIGLKLKEKNNLRWIADFRDPWTTIGYHKSLKLTDFVENKHLKLEHKVLNSADAVVVTSPTTQKEFQKITSKPIKLITNGYDTEDVSKQPLDKKFSLAHIGSFLSERNPVFLWECISELIYEIPDFKSNLEIKLIGVVGQEILDKLKEFSLTEFINYKGYVSHKEAIEEQRKSQVLLLIEINSEETKGIIPGKLFEYMVSERPIIAIGPQNSDFALIIKETNTGVFFDYSEKIKLKSTILNYYNEFLDKKLRSHALGLQKYSRKNLTRELSELITTTA